MNSHINNNFYYYSHIPGEPMVGADFETIKVAAGSAVTVVPSIVEPERGEGEANDIALWGHDPLNTLKTCIRKF